MEIELALRLLAIAGPFLIKAGIDATEAIKRMKNGETVEQLMAELDLKKNDLPELDFGGETEAAKLMREIGDNQDG